MIIREYYGKLYTRKGQKAYSSQMLNQEETDNLTEKSREAKYNL